MAKAKKAVYQVVGARELRRTLKEAGDDLSDLKAAHKAAAEVAAARIRQKAPDSSGALVATIRAAGTKTAGIVRAGNNTKVRYAGVVNYGWPLRNIRVNYFANTGAKESENQWVPLYAQAVENALNKIKGA